MHQPTKDELQELLRTHNMKIAELARMLNEHLTKAGHEEIARRTVNGWVLGEINMTKATHQTAYAELVKKLNRKGKK